MQSSTLESTKTREEHQLRHLMHLFNAEIAELLLANRQLMQNASNTNLDGRLKSPFAL
jgi:hypothetical protein